MKWLYMVVHIFFESDSYKIFFLVNTVILLHKGADWMRNQLEEKRAGKSKAKASASEEKIENTVIKAFAKSMDKSGQIVQNDRKMGMTFLPEEFLEGGLFVFLDVFLKRGKKVHVVSKGGSIVYFIEGRSPSQT